MLYIVVSRVGENNNILILLKLLKNPQMGNVKVVNRVDMLSFAISSKEEDAKKWMQIVTVIQAVIQEPSRKNQPAKTYDKMLENTRVHITWGVEAYIRNVYEFC